MEVVLMFEIVTGGRAAQPSNELATFSLSADGETIADTMV